MIITEWIKKAFVKLLIDLYNQYNFSHNFAAILTKRTTLSQIKTLTFFVIVGMPAPKKPFRSQR